jgi:hypothetical protein
MNNMKEFKEASENITKSRAYIDLAKKLKLEHEVAGVSISVQELIDALQKMKPTDRLVIVQDGYCADGQFGFFDDINDLTPVKGIDGVFKLGYSVQNY